MAVGYSFGLWRRHFCPFCFAVVNDPVSYAVLMSCLSAMAPSPPYRTLLTAYAPRDSLRDAPSIL